MGTQSWCRLCGVDISGGSICERCTQLNAKQVNWLLKHPTQRVVDRRSEDAKSPMA